MPSLWPNLDPTVALVDAETRGMILNHGGEVPNLVVMELSSTLSVWQYTNLPDAGHNDSVDPFHRVTTLVKGADVNPVYAPHVVRFFQK